MVSFTISDSLINSCRVRCAYHDEPKRTPLWYAQHILRNGNSHCCSMGIAYYLHLYQSII